VSASGRAYKNARRFRRELSLPEKLLWVRIRRSELNFRRQHPIGEYVLDFYCPAAKLAIEVDGAAHDFGDGHGATIAGPNGWGSKVFRSCAFRPRTCLPIRMRLRTRL